MAKTNAVAAAPLRILVSIVNRDQSLTRFIHKCSCVTARMEGQST